MFDLEISLLTSIEGRIPKCEALVGGAVRKSLRQGKGAPNPASPHPELSPLAHQEHLVLPRAAVLDLFGVQGEDKVLVAAIPACALMDLEFAQQKTAKNALIMALDENEIEAGPGERVHQILQVWGVIG